MKKTICLLIALMLLALCFTSCSKTNDTPTDTLSDTVSEQESNDATSTETEKDESEINKIEDIVNCEGVVSVTEIPLKGENNSVAYEVIFISENLKIRADIVAPKDYTKNNYPMIFYMPDIGIVPAELATLFSQNGVITARFYRRGLDKSEGVRNLGGTDHNDVITLANILSQISCFEESKKIIAGSSEGSILALRASAECDIFDGCAVTDTISDIPAFIEAGGESMKNFFASIIGKSYEEAPQEYEKRSAAYFTDKLKLPILIIAYREHPQFPIEQATLLHEKLQSEGKTSEIFYIDGIGSDFANETASKKLLSWIRSVN